MPGILEITEQSYLISLFKKGDKQGFDGLYATYSKALFGIISKTCHDTRQAESVLQGSLIAAWQRRNDYNPLKQHFFAWLLVITRQVMHEAVAEKNSDALQIQTDNNNVLIKEDIITLVFYKGYSLEDAATILCLSLAETRILLKEEVDTFRIADTK